MEGRYYEVNIAKQNGETDFWGNPRYLHWAKVILREDFESVAKAKFAEIKGRFPAPEFKCELSFVETTYKRISVKED